MTAKTRTTLSLPSKLLQATDELIAKGKIKNRNEFIAEAIALRLQALEKEEIDAEFAHMANDTEYQEEALQIEAEFTSASWEALNIGESQ